MNNTTKGYVENAIYPLLLIIISNKPEKVVKFHLSIEIQVIPIIVIL
jgi:hypothetical protein